MIFKCRKCNFEFPILEGAKQFKCPRCKQRYEDLSLPKDLLNVRGQIIRKQPKIKMSKKDRLKRRNKVIHIGD
jgi:hypothetical protein